MVKESLRILTFKKIKVEEFQKYEKMKNLVIRIFMNLRKLSNLKY